MSQRNFMRRLFVKHGKNEKAIVTAYANAERQSKVRRKRNANDLTPEQYAGALYQDGIKKGWIEG